jgi:phospholipid-binding lipoprotein MlaA
LRPRLYITLVGFGAAFLASNVRAQTPEDPYEGINRRFYASAMHISDRYFQPIVRLYHWLTPGPIGVAIHNIITNLGEPVVIANDVLQMRLKAAGRDTVRFVGNSTVGIGGVMDVATRGGLPHHDNDFGITLGVWRFKPGPYLFIPFIGPSSVRDGIGLGVDVLLNPLTYARFPGRLTLLYSNAAVGTLDKQFYSQAELDAATADATDPYATLRSLYLQSREAEVRGEDAGPVLPPLDDPEPTPAPVQGAPAQTAPGPSADAAPISTAPDDQEQPVQLAEASDPDAPMATAFPCDAVQAAPRQLAAAN